MATYSGTPELMEESAAELRAIPSRLQAAVDGLRSAAMNYTGGNSGAAVQAYQEVQTVWDQQRQEIEAGSNQAGTALERIADAFRAGDRQGASLF